MHRYSIFTLICVLLSSCTHRNTIEYRLNQIQGDRNLGGRLAAHEKNYLEMRLNFEPFAEMRQVVEKREGLVLKNRGEAHVTVITPPEFKKIQHLIPMKEIQQIAWNNGLQETPLKLICIGKGQHREGPALGVTYYVVVQADRLFEIRRKIADAYVQKGGQTSEFMPDLYYPHVTLGFTTRDLHLEDGVVKDESSCVFQLKSEKP